MVNEVDYSRKMNLLSNFGFLLLLNYVPAAAYMTIWKQWGPTQYIDLDGLKVSGLSIHGPV